MGAKIHYYNGEILNQETGSIYLEEYPVEKGKPRKALVLCGGCGKTYIAPIKKVKAGHLCPECGHRKTGEKRQLQYSYGQVLNEYGSTYVSFDHRDVYGVHYAKIKCGLCGQEYVSAVHQVKSGHCCESCRGKKVSQSKMKYREGDILFSKKGTKFKFIKEITNFEKDKYRKGIFAVILENNKLSKPFPANLGSIIEGSANGGFGMSIGEINFFQSLSDLNLDFRWQYTFEDLVAPDTKAKLKYDFAVFIGEKIYLFELDGEQHYKPVKRFGGEESFQRTVLLDTLKNDYVEQHPNLNLVRISYTEYSKIDKNYIKQLFIERGEVIG